ncbi:uncharacterized protein [Temnothorax longispinosus]|uniref:uncharacterized protein isoform X2 n=1 Tax=Temnothorax longispinosus TaxID=300112 RepID=UPI003A99E5AC
MVAYFERNPHVASGKFTTLHGNENLRGSWEELAQDLNMLSNKGKGKDVKSWKTTWRDLKSKVSEKIQKLRKERRMTGNNPINIKLSELDKRVLGIIGKDYVEGLCNVPDSFPEECTNAIEELRTGNESALSATPGPIIIAELNNIGTNDGAILLDDPYSIQSTSQDVLQDTANMENMENMGDMGDMENMENIENIDTLNVTNTTNIPTQPTHGIQRSGASNPSKRRKARLSDNLNEARESFVAIAERHAEAMKMLAESMKLQAEATLQLSNNMQKLAENERRQITILENLVKRVA